MIYKFSNLEISIGTANTVYDNPLVRLVNTTASEEVVTVATSSASPSINICSFTILANSEMVVEKTSTHVIQANNVLAAPVAYRY